MSDTLKLDKSLKGQFNNYLTDNDQLKFIIDLALNTRMSDIYITVGKAVQYKKKGIITLSQETIPESMKFSNIISYNDFESFLKSIMPSEDDIMMLKNLLKEKQSYDYGIGYKFKHEKKDENGELVVVDEDIRLRLNFVNTLDGIMLTIRPLLNLGLTYDNLTSLKWAIKYGKELVDELKDDYISKEIKNNFLSQLQKMDKVSDIIKSDFSRSNGLILVTGSTGEGKSTLVTALLDDIIENTDKHILTLEDPIEYIFKPTKGKVTQIEVGTHVESFSSGIRGSKRENPDIVYIQEIRDKESAKALMELLGSGVLVITTLHTGSVSETIDRLIGLMSEDNNQDYVRTFISRQLISIINQKLIYVDFKDKIITKGIQEYLHVAGTSRTNIKENKYNQLESDILDSQPPNKSITKILRIFYVLGIIKMKDLLHNVTNLDSLESLISDDKSTIREPDLQIFLDYFGVDSLEKLRGV